MSYVHPEREEFLPDAVLRATPLPIDRAPRVDVYVDQQRPYDWDEPELAPRPAGRTDVRTCSRP